MNRYLPILLAAFVLLVAPLCPRGQEGSSPRIFSNGYDDTPLLPGSSWRVHDAKRPHPRIVDPGTLSAKAQPVKPPGDAIVLFDGSDLAQWRTAKGDAAGWKITDGVLEVVPKSGDIYTRRQFADVQLHVEWLTNNTLPTKGEAWGNSGVFLYGVYELQVWDSYRTNNIYADGQAGAIYGQFPPLVNASRRPDEWQAFDILFTAPRFAAGKLQAPAYVTVIHNGVVIHNHVSVLGEGGHRVLPPYVDRGPSGPIRLQDHGEPVRYRNIWVRELKGYDQP